MPRNEELNQKMREERQQVLLASALELFAENGYFATKISDIAKHARISQGSLYHYYRSKEEIFIALIGSAFDKMNQAAKQLNALPLSPAEKIKKSFADMLAQIESEDSFSNYFMLIAQATASDATPEGVKKIIRAKQNTPYEVLSDIMETGQKDGSIVKADPDELATLFWVIIKGLALHKSAFGKKFKAPSLELLTSHFFTKQWNNDEI